MNMIIGAAAMTSAAAITGAEAGFEASPGVEPIFELIEAHREACAAHLAALDEQTRLEGLHDRDADRVADEPCHAEWRAFEALIDTPPVTFAGLVAWATYLDGVRREDPWKFDDDPAKGLVGTLARALGNLEMQSMGSEA